MKKAEKPQWSRLQNSKKTSSTHHNTIYVTVQYITVNSKTK